MIIEIIKKSIPDNPAIAFSGGLDSSLLAFLSKNPTLYTLNIIDSQDLKWARYIAKKYNFELIEIKIDKNELIDIYKEYRKLYNPVKSQVYAPTELLIKYIDRKEIVFGSGSEEVFAGYDRYYKASNYLEMLRKEFYEGYDIKVISNIAQKYGKKAIFPFYNSELFEYVMQNYSKELLKDPIRKKGVLRDAARGILPSEILDRPKKALQYGSGASKILKNF